MVNLPENFMKNFMRKGEEKAKSKSRDGCVTFKLKTLEIFLSTYAQTSEAYNLHLEQKIAKCSTYERRFGHFSVPEQFLGRQARLVLFLPIAILYFENLQLYHLRLGMTGSVALSCRQNNQHEYYAASSGFSNVDATRSRQPLRATVCFSIEHARPRDLYAKRQMT